MTLDTEGEDKRAEQPAAPLTLRLFQGLSGIAILLVLLGYSLYRALDAGETQPVGGSTTQVRTASPRYVAPPFTYDGPTSAPGSSIVLLMLLCDGENVGTAIYEGPIYHTYIVLERDRDHDVIANFMMGKETFIPANAFVIQSKCFQAAVQDGASS